ncbi:MAG: HAMP domain-containing histidine kinase [Candidatus Aegiribacteria sp.]|nr:HAMP domain-containing histidine kinase [Candidatus Aegiribacteria sp.]
MARKFVVGVELLTGLAIGAAAAAAAVSFIIVFLVQIDMSAETDHMATVTAFVLANSFESINNIDTFEETVSPLIWSGRLEAFAVVDISGNLITGAGLSGDEIPKPVETDEWYFSEMQDSGLFMGVKPPQSRYAFIYRTLLIGFAVLTLALSVLAVITPRYLTKAVITPLREILVEADKFSSGGGSSAEAAGASFHRLMELLHNKDKQLNELRRVAEERADIIEKRSTAILSVLGSAVLALDGIGELSLFNRQSGDLFNLNDNNLHSEFPWNRTVAGRALKTVLDELGESGERTAEFQIQESFMHPAKMYGVSISRSQADEITILVTDVTRISELERNIADQAAMADIGAASAGISHEMGNTLCALSGYFDLLTRGHSDERTLKILSEVRREMNSAQELIDSFGSFAKSPEPVTSQLRRDDVLSICTRSCEEYKIKYSISMTDKEFSLNADRKLLAICVRNLVRNALEADSETTLEIIVKASDDSITISVTDTGPGLTLEPEEIFRPFRTTKNRSGGNMGLGLSISRRIIRSMGGELSGANMENRGTVFMILLPVSRRKDNDAY